MTITEVYYHGVTCLMQGANHHWGLKLTLKTWTSEVKTQFSTQFISQEMWGMGLCPWTHFNELFDWLKVGDSCTVEDVLGDEFLLEEAAGWQCPMQVLLHLHWEQLLSWAPGRWVCCHLGASLAVLGQSDDELQLDWWANEPCDSQVWAHQIARSESAPSPILKILAGLQPQYIQTLTQMVSSNLSNSDMCAHNPRKDSRNTSAACKQHSARSAISNSLICFSIVPSSARQLYPLHCLQILP